MLFCTQNNVNSNCPKNLFFCDRYPVEDDDDDDDDDDGDGDDDG